MAMIPMKQKAIVHKYGEPNSWGEQEIIESKEYKVRVDNSIKEIKNVLGKEVISTAQVWFDKYPDITYKDKVEYVDEWGNSFYRHPELIEPIRMFMKKPPLTIVYL